MKILLQDRGRSESLKLPSLSPKLHLSEASDDDMILNEKLHRKQTRQFDIKEFLKLSTPFAMAKYAESAKKKSDVRLKTRVQGKVCFSCVATGRGGGLSTSGLGHEMLT